jgi:hypothetical protein
VPDWCFDNLIARGGEKRLEKLREAACGPRGEIDFERLDPSPPGPEEEARVWRAAHWGCTDRADPDSVRVLDGGPGVLAYRLSTPWSPPDGIVATLAALFPEVSLELAFLQPARGFSGIVEFAAGAEVGRRESEEPGEVRRLVEEGFGEAEAAELLGPPG